MTPIVFSLNACVINLKTRSSLSEINLKYGCRRGLSKYIICSTVELWPKYSSDCRMAYCYAFGTRKTDNVNQFNCILIVFQWYSILQIRYFRPIRKCRDIYIDLINISHLSKLLFPVEKNIITKFFCTKQTKTGNRRSIERLLFDLNMRINNSCTKYI